MSVEVCTLKARPDLRAAVFAAPFRPPFWPEFMLHDAAAPLYFGDGFFEVSRVVPSKWSDLQLVGACVRTGCHIARLGGGPMVSINTVSQRNSLTTRQLSASCIQCTRLSSQA
jgi:hypothetical protein